MQCLFFLEMSSFVCGMILFGFGSFLTLLGVMSCMFIYRTVRRRRESEESRDHFDILDLVPILNRHKIDSYGSDKEFNYEGLLAGPSTNITASGETEVLLKEVSTKCKDHNKSEVTGDLSLAKAYAQWPKFPLRTNSYANMIVEDLSIDSVEKKRNPTRIDLPISIIEESERILCSSSSSENASFTQSAAFKNRVILYDLKIQSLRVLPDLYNIGMHVVPSQCNTDVVKLDSNGGSSTIANELSLSVRKEVQLKTKPPTSISFPRRTSQKNKNVTGNANANNQCSVFSQRQETVEGSWEKLHNYVPQFIISNCINDLINHM